MFTIIKIATFSLPFSGCSIYHPLYGK